jgi:K+-transporting ATPase ATPase A chain
MTLNGILQIVLFSVVIVLLVKPVGAFMTRIFTSDKTTAFERALYKLCAVDAKAEQTWTRYGIAMLLFNLVGAVVLYMLERLQGMLPLNPEHFPGVAPDLALNTAISFVTNTNWQAYSGESTMSYLVQMLGLTVHNFLSAATGIALAVALIRGFARRSSQTIGNFWVDMTRTTLYVLMPISIIMAVVLIAARMSMRQLWKAPSKLSQSVPLPRRKRSRCWAPMAAAFSMSTPPIRSKTRPALPT